LAVYNHITLTSTDPTIPAPTIEDVIPRTRKYFKGPIEVGEDLMIIEITDKVLVQRFNAIKK
jgi:ribonuclease Z